MNNRASNGMGARTRVISLDSARTALRIALLCALLAMPVALAGCRLLAAGAVGAGAGYIAGSAAADDENDDDDD